MTITRLGETKKGRFSVFADGEFLFSVHKDIFLSRKELELGREVSVELLEEIRLEDEAYSCKEKALTLLEYSAHSAGRLAEKLRRFYPPETVDITIERLGELGLLDDLDYGRRLAADLLNLRGYSLGRVRQALFQRRLDRETIEQVMEELEDIDQVGPIVALVKKKYLSGVSGPSEGGCRPPAPGLRLRRDTGGAGPGAGGTAGGRGGRRAYL